VIFEAFNRYAGVGVGENLGYLFTALWTMMVAMVMSSSALPLRTWLGGLGLVSAASIMVGMLEPAGVDPAADIVVIGYILWSLWLALFGASVLRSRHAANRAGETRPARRPVTGVLPV
jgi:hypothetical protein